MILDEIKTVSELLEKKDFKKLREVLDNINSADFTEMFEELKQEDVVVVYRLLSKDKAVDVFSYLEPDIQERLIEVLTDKELGYVVNELFVDDAVDLIEEMPAMVVKRILKQIKPGQRKIVNELLNYPEDCAGTIMTTEYIDFKEDMTVEQCFNRIKKIGIHKETVYTGYVLTADRKILGFVDIKDLLLAERDVLVKELMETNVLVAKTIDDKEDVAKLFDKYDIMALPVVDKEERLVGIITVDDAIDVFKEEVSEDFEKMAAIVPNEDSYFKTSVLKHAKNRIVWLLVLMLSSAVTGAIITKYEEAFAVVPVLVSFIPMIMGTGGNCGSQSSTLVIRGMAVDEIKLKDWLKAVWKEFRVAILVGIALFLVNGLRIMIQYKDMKLVMIVGISLFVTVMLSKLIGCILPMLAKKFKLDPAIMAAPLITTIVDTCSVLTFFSVAMQFLNL